MNLSPNQERTLYNLYQGGLKGLMVYKEIHRGLLMIQVTENLFTPWRFFGSIDLAGNFQGVD